MDNYICDYFFLSDDLQKKPEYNRQIKTNSLTNKKGGQKCATKK